jgi:hypothetical protein
LQPDIRLLCLFFPKLNKNLSQNKNFGEKKEVGLKKIEYIVIAEKYLITHLLTLLKGAI